MSDEIVINRGECLSVQLNYTDENGAPIDITGATFALADVWPSPVVAVFTITDAPNGAATLYVADTTPFPIGRRSRFRIKMNLGGACDEVTPPIWVDVQ